MGRGFIYFNKWRKSFHIRIILKRKNNYAKKKVSILLCFLAILSVASLTVGTVACGSKATPKLSSIVITPSSPADIIVGSTLQFTATGTYSDGATVDITSQVSWSSNNTGVATINSAGLATGLLAGSTNIMAAMSGVISLSVTLTVMQSFGPSSFNIGIGSGNFPISSINAGDTVEFQFG